VTGGCETVTPLWPAIFMVVTGCAPAFPRRVSMAWRNECTANFLGPFQRTIMDFLILMVRDVPKIGASGESPGKTEVISWVPEEPSAFPPRAVRLPGLRLQKEKYHTESKWLTLRMAYRANKERAGVHNPKAKRLVPDPQLMSV
jgi:hypothetical protein